MTRRALFGSSLALAFAALAHAQSPPVPVLTATALAPLDGPICPTPFRSSCPQPPGDPVCRARQSARSPDGRVVVELVEDGWTNDLVALHLVARVGTRAFVQRDIGRAGVGCGTDGLYGARFDVTELAVRDVLGDRAPEIVLRAEHASDSVLFVCSTGGAAPRCARTIIRAQPPRFVRPDLVVEDGVRVRVVW